MKIDKCILNLNLVLEVEKIFQVWYAVSFILQSFLSRYGKE